MTKQIFVVDDEESVRYTVKAGIEGLDNEYEVVPVDNGEFLLDLLEHDQVPDLILLDLMMPGMNGWEVQKRLKQHASWRQIPLVFLSGVGDDTSKIVGGLSGDDYIEKPFSIPDLKQRIDRILKP